MASATKITLDSFLKCAFAPLQGRIGQTVESIVNMGIILKVFYLSNKMLLILNVEDDLNNKNHIGLLPEVSLCSCTGKWRSNS